MTSDSDSAQSAERSTPLKRTRIRADLTYCAQTPDSRLQLVTIPLLLTRKQFDALMLKVPTLEQLAAVMGQASDGERRRD